VPAGRALRRDGARPGHALYVSGTVGDAAAGLKVLRGELRAPAAAVGFLRQRFEYPQPRLSLGLALRGLASACIDVSDGLYVDAQRLLRASGCSARIDLEALPLSAALRQSAGDAAWQQGLEGGEDYELCFSAPAACAGAIEAAAADSATAVSRIGVIEAGQGIEIHSGNSVMQFSPLGFDHFRD
jgi:thiamine-monophosphate kinase